ncbi:MAG: hypothetical protein KGJ79_08545 [Alphaproteobacteria bacterium]|nr:hypothetical protein [Alphaproteobacteria bacterium]MDE2111178.1 hypothetical protein [Alphaproteobacteria bacterium]MDE2495996.1 hypothetical protein [Alphaproteobacteria bacterium]
MKKSVPYAVLTGDLIKSAKLSSSELQAARKTLSRAVARLRKWKTPAVCGELDFFRGDAWQLLANDAALGLRIALFLRASMIASGTGDTRIAIGIGAIETIDKRRASLSGGEAFSLSGRALDDMTVYEHVTVALRKDAEPLATWVSVAAQLCGVLVDHWSPRQAEMICDAITPRRSAATYDAIAKRLDQPVSKQAVTKALSHAGWRQVRGAIEMFERTKWAAVLDGF